jgi:hypothetical protein
MDAIMIIGEQGQERFPPSSAPAFEESVHRLVEDATRAGVCRCRRSLGQAEARCESGRASAEQKFST